uniref:YidC/Oxa1 family membrane protein insertase n=1 Tax=Streptomyces wuyuanensis TaxID=1196353 RepID=UPI003D74B16A
ESRRRGTFDPAVQKNVDLTVKTPYMQQQKMLMYIFPLIFAVTGINFPVGVLVYWLTTNVWTMGQQMYVINQNPTPGSKAQDNYLQRLLKSVSSRGEVRGRRRRSVVQAIVAKGSDRNDNERKFIAGLAKAGFAAQADGTVIKSDTVMADADGGSAARRQQPKRQSKAQRQSGGTQQPGEAKPSLEKHDQQQDAKPKPAAGKTAPGTPRQAKSGQRKGSQRPKHPSSKK